jgi:hypothetical protein
VLGEVMMEARPPGRRAGSSPLTPRPRSRLPGRSPPTWREMTWRKRNTLTAVEPGATRRLHDSHVTKLRTVGTKKDPVVTAALIEPELVVLGLRH